jgi:hypothetical protein
MMNDALPAQFSDLAERLTDWRFEQERERANKRITAPIADLRSFCAQMRPRMDDVFAYLNGFENDPERLPDDAKNLYLLALMFMEASVPIDLEWERGDIEDTFPMERLEFLTLPGRSNAIT